MLKKVLIDVLAVVILASTGLFSWARAVFTQDSVRMALAAQLSKSLGQPVTIGSIGATVYPRVTVNLREVAIGEPRRIRIETLHVGTDFGALLSRRVEHAALRGDIEIVPQGKGVTLRRVTLVMGDTTIDMTGQIADLSGPIGELAVKADGLNFDHLLASVSDFAGSAGMAGSAGTPPPAGAPAGTSAMNIAVSLGADRATIGALSIEKLSGLARVTPDSITLEPIGFGLFGGNYKGALALTLGSRPGFRLNAVLSGIDMAAATTFAGSPDTITGRLSGEIDLSGHDMTTADVLKTARGTARVDITNGTVSRLGLVQTVVIATSG